MDKGKVDNEINTRESYRVEKNGSTRLQFLAACSATLGYFCCGCFLGWSSSALPKIQYPDSFFPITSSQAAWIASFTSLGKLCASVPAGYMAEVIGRKPVLAFAIMPLLTSWIMVFLTRSVSVLYIARVIGGCGMGIMFAVGPMYTGEIAEDRIRGTLGTLFQVQLNLGTVFEYAVGPYVTYTELAIITMVFPIIFILTFIWMPETPYYLLAKNSPEDAEKSLLRLRGNKSPDIIEAELEKMKNFVEKKAKQKGSFRDLFGSWTNIQALIIVLGLFIIQNFSGIGAIQAFISSILEDSALDSDVSAIIFGVVMLVVSVVCSGLVDRTGRRPLLLLSSAGCAITLAIEGLYFFLTEKHYDDTTAFDWLPLTCLLLYTITYSLGLGPLPYAVAGEIFPANVKSLAISLEATGHSIFAFISIKLFQVMKDGMGQFFAFWVFSGSCFLGTIFIALLLPETKGKSFQEIVDEMKRNRERPFKEKRIEEETT